MLKTIPHRRLYDAKATSFSPCIYDVGTAAAAWTKRNQKLRESPESTAALPANIRAKQWSRDGSAAMTISNQRAEMTRRYNISRARTTVIVRLRRIWDPLTSSAKWQNRVNYLAEIYSQSQSWAARRNRITFMKAKFKITVLVGIWPRNSTVITPLWFII